MTDRASLIEPSVSSLALTEWRLTNTVDTLRFTAF